MTKIAFIGGGKMAEAFVARLPEPQNIIVSDVSAARLAFLKKKYKVKTAKNNLEAWEKGQIVVLAVKPQNMDKVLSPESCILGQGKLVISIAAGIPLSYLQKKLPGLAIVRAMPNNPCLVGKGMIAVAKGKKVSATQFKKAVELFKATGEVVAVPEKLMDAVTGLSGSGPAFVYQAVAGLIDGGVKAGLSKAVATKLALQTMLGSVETIKQTGKTPDQLTEMVASPGGTTIEGLKVLKQKKLKKTLAEAVMAAAKKSKKLSGKY